MALGIRKRQEDPSGGVPRLLRALTRHFRWQPPIDEAYEDAYKRLFDILVRYVRPLVDDDAEDVVNDLFLTLLDGWDERTPEQRSDSVIATMAWRDALDVRKRRGRGKRAHREYARRQPVAEPLHADADVVMQELHDVIFAVLPERCAEVYWYVKQNDCSYKEAAEVFRIRVSTVKSHVKHGNARTRQALIEAGYGPSSSSPPASLPPGRNARPAVMVPPTRQSDEKGRAR
jgi:RNA polymerase sigma factor (sigma-70 family)